MDTDMESSHTDRAAKEKSGYHDISCPYKSVQSAPSSFLLLSYAGTYESMSS